MPETHRGNYVTNLLRRVADEDGCWFVAGVHLDERAFVRGLDLGYLAYADDILELTEAGRAVLAVVDRGVIAITPVMGST